ncbi:MAG: hypothetical protein Kow00124_19310 [Anaerolineae bacterium]
MAETQEYRFLLLEPTLTGAWFFQAARQFWLRFRPIVTVDPALLSIVPEGAALTVIVIARSASTADLLAQVQALTGHRARIDLVRADDLPLAEVILNTRAASGQMLGDGEGASG